MVQQTSASGKIEEKKHMSTPKYVIVYSLQAGNHLWKGVKN